MYTNPNHITQWIPSKWISHVITTHFREQDMPLSVGPLPQDAPPPQREMDGAPWKEHADSREQGILQKARDFQGSATNSEERV